MCAAVIAQRVSDWAQRDNIISPTQKGFLPYEGWLEHGFVLKSILQDTHRRKKAANIVWLDLKDAFGSVLHTVLLEVQRLVGLHGSIIAAIEDHL